MTERPYKSRPGRGRGPGYWRKREPHERRAGIQGGIWVPHPYVTVVWAGREVRMRLVTDEAELAAMVERKA